LVPKAPQARHSRAAAVRPWIQGSQDEIVARRAGIPLHYGLGFTAAPSALDYLGFD
jgi:hypothetical protein